MNDTFRPADSTLDTSGRNLDQAIDQAVREVMSVDGPADLRARVLSRLEPSPSRIFTWPRLVAAAAMVVLVTVLLMRAPRPAPSDTQAGTSSSPPPSVDVPLNPRADVPGASGVQYPARHAAPRARKVEPTVAEEIPETIAPLDELDPIVVTPPLTRDIEPAEIHIAPLPAIADLSVEPVAFPPGERN